MSWTQETIEKFAQEVLEHFDVARRCRIELKVEDLGFTHGIQKLGCTVPPFKDGDTPEDTLQKASTLKWEISFCPAILNASETLGKLLINHEVCHVVDFFLCKGKGYHAHSFHKLETDGCETFLGMVPRYFPIPEIEYSIINCFLRHRGRCLQGVSSEDLNDLVSPYIRSLHDPKTGKMLVNVLQEVEKLLNPSNPVQKAA